MTKYEYLVSAWISKNHTYSLQDILNDYGSKGYILCWVEETKKDKRYIFFREIDK